jgi:hypothetical protein
LLNFGVTSHVSVEIFRPSIEESSLVYTVAHLTEIAAVIKKHFEQKYGQIWHCVVGKSFGVFGTYETKHFVDLDSGATAIQIWKSGIIQPLGTKRGEKNKSNRQNDFSLEE